MRLKRSVVRQNMFYSVLSPLLNYFSLYETAQSVGRAKTDNSKKKETHDTPASRTWLVLHVSHMGLESTPDTAVR